MDYAEKHNMMIGMVLDLMRQKPFLNLASTFRPHQAKSMRKIRLGSEFDGGYVMLDDFKDIALALSFGIESNASWDLQVAGRGIPVWQYDHTIPIGPVDHEKIKFHPLKIVAMPDGEGRTIGEILSEAKVTQDASVILKIDIEHDEWLVFDEASDRDLAKFSQILIEMHTFSRATDRLWLDRATRVMEKLNRHFAAVHVHANNWTPMIAISNVSFPETLEVCFASRKRYDLTPSDEMFPGPLDQPNNPLLPDIFLGNFRYG